MDADLFAPTAEAIERLRRDIAAYEAERPAIARRVRRRTWVIMTLYAIVAAIGVVIAWPVLLRGTDDVLALSVLGVLVAGGIAAWFVARQPASALRAGFRDRLFPVVFGFVDDLKHFRSRAPDFFLLLPGELTGVYTSKSFDDGLSGRFDGSDFELCEAELVFQTSNSPDKVAFRGVILSLILSRPFAGRLFGTSRIGGVAKWVRDTFQANGLVEIASGNKVLDDAYEFRTSNPDAAGPLLTGPLQRAFEFALENWGGKAIRLGLVDDRCFLLLPTEQGRDLFELPDIDTPIDFNRHVAPIIEELARILTIGRLIVRANA